MTREATPLRSRAGGLSDLLKLAGPVIASRIGVMTMGLTDTVVVGHAAPAQLAHLALAWAPTSVVLTTGMGLLQGVQVLTSRHVGAGRPELTGAVLRRGLVYAAWIGLASAILLAVGGGPVLRALGVQPALVAGATPVLQVLAASLPSMLLGVVLSMFLEAHARPMAGFWLMVLANLANLGLNLLLVGGSFGLPALGAVGSAVGTFGARTLLLAGLALFLVTRPEARGLGLFQRPPKDRFASGEQRRIGYGAGVSYFVEVAAFAAMNVLAGRLGAEVVASWSIVLNVAAMVFMAPLGLSVATSVLVGRAFGAGDAAGEVSAASLGFGVCVAMLSVVSLVIGVWPHAVASLYTGDPRLQAKAAGALLLCVLFYVPDGLQVVAGQSLRARSDIWMPTLTHTLSYAVFMIPFGWWLSTPQGLGLHGLVWAVIAASWLAAALLLGRFAWLIRGDLRRRGSSPLRAAPRRASPA